MICGRKPEGLSESPARETGAGLLCFGFLGAILVFVKPRFMLTFFSREKVSSSRFDGTALVGPGFSRSAALAIGAVAAIVFFLQVVPRFSLDAPVVDEIYDLVNGYYCWKGEVVHEPTHPPFGKALQSLPLLGPNIDAKATPLTDLPRWERLEGFLQAAGPEGVSSLLRNGRWVTAWFGFGIGLLIFLSVRKRPPVVFLTALLLWAFEPNLLAFSGFAKADVLLTFFVFAFFMVLRKAMREDPGMGFGVFSGVLAAMAMTTKFSGVAMLPAWVALEWLEWRRKGAQSSSPLCGRRGLGMMLGFLGMVGLVYLPETMRASSFRLPWHYFVQAFRIEWDYAGHPVFFMGKTTTTSHLLYYPTALFLKTTLAFSILLLSGWWMTLRRRTWEDAWTWLPGVAYFLTMTPALNTGIRNVLPAFPFFILTAAEASGQYWNLLSSTAPRIRVIALGLLLTSHVVSGLHAYPSHLSYFNDLVPPSKKILLLGDSNLDLGQDNLRFARFAQARGWTGVRIVRFMGEDPVQYGLRGSAWDKEDFKHPKPGRVYAYNASFIQLAHAYNPQMPEMIEGWWRRAPFKRFMDTWYYLEVPAKPSLE